MTTPTLEPAASSAPAPRLGERLIAAGKLSERDLHNALQAHSMYYRQHESNQIGANHGWGAWSARWKMLRSKSFRKQVNLIASLVSPERVRDISDNLFLLKNCSQLRRRPRDAFFLFLLILFGVY